MSESTEDYLRRIGRREAMEERQRQRLAGEINAPLRGPRSLRDCAKYLREHGLVEAMKPAKSNKTDPPAHPPKPFVVIPAKPVPKQPKKDWKSRGRSSN